MFKQHMHGERLFQIAEAKNKMGKTNGFRSLGMYYGLAFALGTALLVDAGYKFLSKKPLKEPTRQEFKSDVLNLENEFLWDIDGDGCVDLITDRGDICWVRCSNFQTMFMDWYLIWRKTKSLQWFLGPILPSEKAIGPNAPEK